MQYSKVFRVPVTNMERASKGVSLSPEDSEFLRKHTKYSEEDIKVWFRSFKKDCPSGILEKKKVNEIYEEKFSKNRFANMLCCLGDHPYTRYFF